MLRIIISMVKNLEKIAKQKKIKYFLVTFVDFFGVQGWARWEEKGKERERRWKRENRVNGRVKLGILPSWSGGGPEISTMWQPASSDPTNSSKVVLKFLQSAPLSEKWRFSSCRFSIHVLLWNLQKQWTSSQLFCDFLFLSSPWLYKLSENAFWRQVWQIIWRWRGTTHRR